MKAKSRFPIDFLIPAIVVIVMGLFWIFGTTKQLELKIMDLYTGMIPAPKEDPHLVVIDIDDKAIQNVGVWPWSRNIHAGILSQLKELGTGSLTFDIEFVDRSPVGVSTRERDQALSSKSTELGQVFDALASGALPAKDAGEAAQTILQEGILLTARDNDTYLGNAIKVFGNAFTTLNYFFKNDSPDAVAAYDYLIKNSALPDVSGDLSKLPLEKDLRGAIVPIASMAAGAGVTNVRQDEDGTLRRICLLFRLRPEGSDHDLVFGQLAFTPLWNKLGRPAIEVQPGHIVLKTSKLAQNPQPDFVIPLDPDGKMIINFPHKKYADSFLHVGVSQLQALQALEDNVVSVLAQVKNAGYLATDFSGLYDDAETLRKQALDQGSPEVFQQYLQKKDEWIAALTDFGQGTREQEILATLNQQMADPKLSASARSQIPDLKTSVSGNFTKFRQALKSWMDLRADLKKTLTNAFSFIGWSSVATTDIGVTPFDKVFYNVGAHMAISNTIFTRSYLNQVVGWISFLGGAILAFATLLFTRRLKTMTGVFVGFGIFLALALGIGLYYGFTGVYVDAFTPGVTVFLTVLTLTLYKFLGSEAEKRYIRNAFGTYLSPDVIKEIEADPDRLNLGGEKREMTAMFTDVKGFSTFSEKLDPNDLVKLLNEYLTVMSDIILDNRGTIDKYEGDAIIAFWGAPTTQPDHAHLALKSAIAMHRIEKSLSDRLVETGLAPSPLYTRIGINTGDMTVGNMGTQRRMNYTIMGNTVNLAARLEGVNKEYGTWILTSQYTQAHASDEFVLRGLDKVRVIGIKTPVRLYEVVDERQNLSAPTIAAIEQFESAMDLYFKREWDRCAAVLNDISRVLPDDGPCKTFLQRCAQYKETPPPEAWDGVFSLTSK